MSDYARNFCPTFKRGTNSVEPQTYPSNFHGKAESEEGQIVRLKFHAIGKNAERHSPPKKLNAKSRFGEDQKIF
jgi:hypothetical protein